MDIFVYSRMNIFTYINIYTHQNYILFRYFCKRRGKKRASEASVLVLSLFRFCWETRVCGDLASV